MGIKARVLETIKWSKRSRQAWHPVAANSRDCASGVHYPLWRDSTLPPSRATQLTSERPRNSSLEGHTTHQWTATAHHWRAAQLATCMVYQAQPTTCMVDPSQPTTCILMGCVGSIINYLQEWPNGQLLVAADNSQLRRMSSEMVDVIGWPLPPPFTGQNLPKLHLDGGTRPPLRA